MSLRCWRWWGRRGNDDGMVTAETAMVLPILVLFALIGVSAVGVVQARLRCADAAREAARAVARGDPGAAEAWARAAAGRPVGIITSVNGEDTKVTVRLAVRPLGWLGPFTVTETAVTATEPAATPAEPSSSDADGP